MTLAVSIQQAAANVLGAWLKQALGADLEIEYRWPDPDKKFTPGGCITILFAGPPVDEMLEPEVVNRKNVTPSRALFLWKYRYRRQPLQLDIWATSKPRRDDLVKRLEDALAAGPSATIGQYNGDPFRHGPVLELADGWSDGEYHAFADFTFDGPSVFDSTDSVKASEFRATLAGVAAVDLTVEAESARLASIALKARLNSGPTQDVTTVTASSVTHSTES